LLTAANVTHGRIITLGVMMLMILGPTDDKGSALDVAVDDVDLAQSKPNFLPQLRKNIAFQMGQTQDAYIASLYEMAGITTTSNDSSTRVTIGSSNVKTEFLLMGKAMDDANVPMEGRWVVIPPELKFELIDAGILEQSNNDNTWKNGEVGRAYGFDIIMSNNVNRLRR